MNVEKCYLYENSSDELGYTRYMSENVSNFWNILFIYIISCHVSIRNAVSFAIEGSVSGVINQVDITPCPSEPCQFKKGVNATIQVEFTPSRFHVYMYIREFTSQVCNIFQMTPH